MPAVDRTTLRGVRRLVIKIGSAVLAPKGELSPASVRQICEQVTEIIASGRQVVIVSSGAVASGFRLLGLEKPPKAIRQKQAAAAIGQPRLMAEYASCFAGDRLAVAQVLLTAEDFEKRARFLNARHTLETLLESGVVPIINENDSVSFDEIKLGDNDRLSALAASMLRADLLLMLSSVPGLLGGTKNVLSHVPDVEAARAHVRAEKSGVGTGGMGTKLDAAAIVTRVGIPAVIASGEVGRVVPRLLEGEDIGTFFEPRRGRAVDSRRRWIGLSARAQGVISIDAGAVGALRKRGASLLASGIAGCQGAFERGAVVEVRGPRSELVARGVSAYSADEIGKIRGRKAGEIARVLGYVVADEVVHRDDLLLTPLEDEP
ncbi:MAG: glutamate 5-kinase [Planctomycetes bacterium]|nr:glutamate 5-kinase [Planctomycetota bacterium]